MNKPTNQIAPKLEIAHNYPGYIYDHMFIIGQD